MHDKKRRLESLLKKLKRKLELQQSKLRRKGRKKRLD
jgi:hypothetical protein